MELNVPTSGVASHESPAVVQLHEDTKVPVSEIKAKLHDKVMELNHERMATPSETAYGNSTEDLRSQSYKEVEDELTKPEETEDAESEEFKSIFGDTYPGASAFAAPQEEPDGVGGGTEFGGGFSDGGMMDAGGIDNNAMGFSDDDMATLNSTAENAFNEFTDNDTIEPEDVNNMSADEPSAPESDEEQVEETPSESTESTESI